MVLSILKGVGGVLFKAEDVKSLFFDLLDCRDQYRNQRDSRQSLSTYEIQILCLLLEVHVVMFYICVLMTGIIALYLQP